MLLPTVMQGVFKRRDLTDRLLTASDEILDEILVHNRREISLPSYFGGWRLKVDTGGSWACDMTSKDALCPTEPSFTPGSSSGPAPESARADASANFGSLCASAKTTP